MTIAGPDRVTMMEVVMAALLADDASATGDPDEVGTARILAVGRAGRVAGIGVAREAFGRMGARLRPLVDEGETVGPGTAVAELGGPLGAIRAAAPTALRLLERLSAIASGQSPPDPGAPLDTWAADLYRLSPPGSVGDDSPSFHLEIEG